MRTLIVFAVMLMAALSACSFGGGAEASAQTSPPATNTLDMRRLWAGDEPNFYVSEPNPDGTLVSEVDWSTGDLAVIDLATGKLRRVTRKGTWTDNSDYAEHSVFSPDGKHLAYSWFSDKDRGHQLRVIGVDGTGMRVLVPPTEDVRYIAAETWSPDGRHIAATIFRRDRSSQIALVDASTGAINVLRTNDWRHPIVVGFSRDGRYLAYDFQPDENGGQRDIYVMPVDASRETRVVSGPANDVLMGWLPDGSGILFYSDRAQTQGVWKQYIRDGRPSGEPQLVRADVWQLIPLGFSRDAYYYGVAVQLPQVQTATVDLNARRVVVPPAAVQSSMLGSSASGEWSPDGRYFAFLRTAPDFDGQSLVVRSLPGPDSREIRLDIAGSYFLQWEPGSRSLLVSGTDVKGRGGWHRIDVASGKTSLVLDAAEIEGGGGRPRLSRDGSYALFFRGRNTGALGFRVTGNAVRRDLATGVETVLQETRSHGPAFFSPDASMYSAKEFDPDTRKASIVIGRTDGAGSLHTIYTTAADIPENRGGFPWTPDGRFVLVPERTHASPGAGGPDEGTSRILMVPVEGGEPTVLLEWSGEIRDLRLSPDGRHISFGAGRVHGEIWRLEGF